MSLREFANSFGVLGQIAGDAVYMFNLKHTPKEYRNLEGLKSFAGLIYMWRKCAGIERSEVNKNVYGAIAYSFTLIKRYDSLIDSKDRNNLTVDNLKNDPRASQLLNDFMHYLITSGISKIEAKIFLSKFSQFRKLEWSLFEEIKNVDINKLSFDEICEYKLKTCGLNSDIAAELIALYHPNLSENIKSSAKKNFFNFMMAAQVYDDKKDVFEDMNERVPNYFGAALNNFENEKKKVFSLLKKGGEIFGQDIVDLSPNSSAMCDGVFNNFLNSIESPQVKKLVYNQYYKRFLVKKIQH